MMLSSGDYKECKLTRSIFDHMLNQYGGNAFKYGGSSVQLNEECNSQVLTKDSLLNETGPSFHSNEENNSGVMTKNCLLDEAPRYQAMNKVEQKYEDDNDISDATPIQTEEFQTMHCQSTMDVDVHSLSKGVLTRSKNRLKNNHEENLSLNTSINPGFTEPVSTSEASANTIAETNTSNVSQSAILSEGNMEVVAEILDNSADRRSNRPKVLSNGVAMRRETTGSKDLRHNQVKNLSSTNLINPGFNDPFCASEASGNQCGGTITKANASNLSLLDKLSEEKMEVEDSLDNSAAKRSRRHKNFSTGVSTRSKTRLKSLRSDPEDNPMEVEVALDNSAVRRSGHGKDLSDPFPTSEASENNCKGQKTTREASSGSFTNILSQEEKELKGTPDKSAVRRSNRLKNLKK